MPNPRIEPLKRVLAIEPTDEVAWFGLGKAYMEDGNFEEAFGGQQALGPEFFDRVVAHGNVGASDVEDHVVVTTFADAFEA